jgi:hypothetical protein
MGGAIEVEFAIKLNALHNTKLKTAKQFIKKPRLTARPLFITLREFS